MIIFVLILAMGLRFISINQSFWIDEATTASTIHMSLGNFFGKFIPGDFHPPFYYLTARLWGDFFGTNEIALRSLSILFALGTIYVVYLIGKELLNKEIGIIASLLLATSGLHIYYSQEARMYSMSTFLVTLAVFSFVKILKEKSRAGYWVLFASLLGLIAATDYLPLLILPVIWIVGFFSRKNIIWWKRFVMSHIILVIFGLGWLPVFIKQFTSGINVTHTSPSWVSVLGTFSFKDILLIPVKFMIGRVGFDNKFIYAAVVGLVFIIFGFLFYKSKKYFKELVSIYLWLIIPILLALIVSIKIPVLNYFRFLFVLPALYLIVASGINALSKRWTRVFIVLLISINLVTSFMYLTNQKFQREDWRDAVNFIESTQTDSSVTIFPADSQMEAYRYYAPHASIYGPNAIKKGYTSLWLVRYAQPISDPQDSTRAQIENLGYHKQNEYDFNGVVVWKYDGLN